MGIWEDVSGLVAEGKVIATDAALLINAAIGGYHDYKSGKAATPLAAMIGQAKQVEPILLAIANLIAPGSGTAVGIGIDVLAFIMTHSHKMTPEEETAWFDRASQTTGL
jgi:hypothetical protein